MYSAYGLAKFYFNLRSERKESREKPLKKALGGNGDMNIVEDP